MHLLPFKTASPARHEIPFRRPTFTERMFMKTAHAFITIGTAALCFFSSPSKPAFFSLRAGSAQEMPADPHAVHKKEEAQRKAHHANRLRERSKEAENEQERLLYLLRAGLLYSDAFSLTGDPKYEKEALAIASLVKRRSPEVAGRIYLALDPQDKKGRVKGIIEGKGDEIEQANLRSRIYETIPVTDLQAAAERALAEAKRIQESGTEGSIQRYFDAARHFAQAYELTENVAYRQQALDALGQMNDETGIYAGYIYALLDMAEQVQAIVERLPSVGRDLFGDLFARVMENGDKKAYRLELHSLIERLVAAKYIERAEEMYQTAEGRAYSDAAGAEDSYAYAAIDFARAYRYLGDNKIKSRAQDAIDQAVSIGKKTPGEAEFWSIAYAAALLGDDPDKYAGDFPPYYKEEFGKLFEDIRARGEVRSNAQERFRTLVRKAYVLEEIGKAKDSLDAGYYDEAAEHYGLAFDASEDGRQKKEIRGHILELAETVEKSGDLVKAGTFYLLVDDVEEARRLAGILAMGKNTKEDSANLYRRIVEYENERTIRSVPLPELPALDEFGALLEMIKTIEEGNAGPVIFVPAGTYREPRPEFEPFTSLGASLAIRADKTLAALVSADLSTTHLSLLDGSKVGLEHVSIGSALRLTDGIQLVVDFSHLNAARGDGFARRTLTHDSAQAGIALYFVGNAGTLRLDATGGLSLSGGSHIENDLSGVAHVQLIYQTRGGTLFYASGHTDSTRPTEMLFETHLPLRGFTTASTLLEVHALTNTIPVSPNGDDPRLYELSADIIFPVISTSDGMLHGSLIARGVFERLDEHEHGHSIIEGGLGGLLTLGPFQLLLTYDTHGQVGAFAGLLIRDDSSPYQGLVSGGLRAGSDGITSKTLRSNVGIR